MRFSYTLAFAVLTLTMAGGTAYGSTMPHQAGAIAGTEHAIPSGSASKTSWGKPVFTDSFSGTKLNLKNWSVYADPRATGDSPRRTKSSVKVRNGSLQLIGHFQKPYGYVSGGIAYNTNQTYGRWVVRFRAEAGAGYRPVVLLWPHGKWPNDGEIDMAEIFSADRIGGKEYLHLGVNNRHKGNPFRSSPNFTRWHVVAVDWLPDHITFWLDGKQQWTVERRTGNSNYIPSTPFHLTLQNDQGCDVDPACKPDKSTPKQVVMQVDWVKIYAPPRSQPLTALHDPNSKGVRGVAYSANGKYLATADANGHAYTWALPGYKRHATLADPASRAARAVAFSPDSATLAIGDSNGRLGLSQPPRFRHLADPASKGINAVAFTTLSHYVAAADANGHTYIWTVATGKILTTLSDPHSTGVRGAAYSPDGKLLATADGNGHIYMWALPDYKLQATLTDPASHGINAVAFTTLSHYVAAADANGHTYIWTVATGKILTTLSNPHGAVRAAAYSPDGKLLATTDSNGHIYLWALPDYKLQATLTDPASHGADTIAFSPHSATLAIGDGNGNGYIYRTSP